MANITPDIMQLMQSLGMPNLANPPAPQVDPQQELQQLIQMLAQQSQQSQQQQMPQQMQSQAAPMPAAQPLQPDQMPMAQQLAQQLMTGGLTNQQNTGETGFNYRGPVSGYTGPLRPSDRPSSIAVPTMKPEQAGAIDEAARLRQTAVPGFKTGGQAMDFAAMTKGLPPELVEQIARMSGIAVPLKASQAGVGKPISVDKLGNFYNKKTGKTAAEEFPDSEPDQAVLRRDYISLDNKAKDRLGNINSLDNTINQYARMAPNFTPEAGIENTAGQWMSTQKNRLGGSPQTADLDSINASITQIARAFGGDSRVSDKEMALLKNAVISDGDNQASIAKKLDNLRVFRDTTAHLVPIPGLQNKYTKDNVQQNQREQVTPEQRAQASSLIVKAKTQLGPNASPEEIKALARKMQAGGNR